MRKLTELMDAYLFSNAFTEFSNNITVIFIEICVHSFFYKKLGSEVRAQSFLTNPKFEGSRFLSSFLICDLFSLKWLYVYCILWLTVLIKWYKYMKMCTSKYNYCGLKCQAKNIFLTRKRPVKKIFSYKTMFPVS